MRKDKFSIYFTYRYYNITKSINWKYMYITCIISKYAMFKKL